MKLQDGKAIPHGYAIAAGMICESYLSNQLSSEEKEEIIQRISDYFPKISLEDRDLDRLVELVQNDKKNHAQQLNFVLLESIGKAAFDVVVQESQIRAALNFYIYEL